MLVPYPDVRSGLAIKPHMYICWHGRATSYKFVKCQSLKPYMVGNPAFVHYIDEDADIERNPFAHATRIDCDKSFETCSVAYDDNLKTTSRPDVCETLFKDVLEELFCDGYCECSIDERELAGRNPLIYLMEPFE